MRRQFPGFHAGADGARTRTPSSIHNHTLALKAGARYVGIRLRLGAPLVMPGTSPAG